MSKVFSKAETHIDLVLGQGVLSDYEEIGTGTAIW